MRVAYRIKLAYDSCFWGKLFSRFSNTQNKREPCKRGERTLYIYSFLYFLSMSYCFFFVSTMSYCYKNVKKNHIYIHIYLYL